MEELYCRRWHVSSKYTSNYIEGRKVLRKSYLFESPVPKTVCKNCSLSYCDLSHVYLDCEQSIQFWDNWSNDLKLSNKSFKATIKDKLKLRKKLLVPPNEENVVYKYPNKELNDQDHVLHLLTLGKSYLFCCSLAGIKPMYSEFYINVTTIPYTKKSTKFDISWEAKNAWMPGCPRPPSKGLFCTWIIIYMI